MELNEVTVVVDGDDSVDEEGSVGIGIGDGDVGDARFVESIGILEDFDGDDV